MPTLTAAEAVDYAIAHGFERRAVIDDREILRHALSRAMLDHSVADIHQAFTQRIQRAPSRMSRSGQGPRAAESPHPGMQELERETIARMTRGQGSPRHLLSAHLRRDLDHALSPLKRPSARRRRPPVGESEPGPRAPRETGTGKTTLLAAIRDLAERDGYDVRG